MVSLYLYCAVGHAIDRLVDHDCGIRLFHDLVYLMALGTDEKRHHSLGHEYYDAKAFVLEFLKLLVDFSKEKLSALILALHLPIVYLHVFTMEVWNSKVSVEADALALCNVLDSLEELVDRVKAIQDVVVNEDLEPKDLFLFRRSIATREAIPGLTIPALEAV